MRLTEDPESHSTYESNLADLEASERLRRELAPFGVTSENAAQRVKTLMEAGRFGEAEALLQVMRRYTTDREEAAQIDQLLSLIAGMPTFNRGPRRPATIREDQSPSLSGVVVRAFGLLFVTWLLWTIFGSVAGGIALAATVVIVVMSVLNLADPDRRRE